MAQQRIILCLLHMDNHSVDPSIDVLYGKSGKYSVV